MVKANIRVITLPAHDISFLFRISHPKSKDDNAQVNLDSYAPPSESLIQERQLTILI